VLKDFKGSLIFTVVALALAGITGYMETGLVSAALSALFICSVLGVMETSLSLDNAIVNASVLKDMDEKWRRRFLTWGILIAVFGMRIFFPLAIVSISAWVNPVEAVRIALFDHVRYEQIVTGAHIGISGFGGAFLMLVGLTFFLDEDREHLWIPAIEKPIAKLAKIPLAPYAVTALIVLGLSMALNAAEAYTFLIAGAAGILSYGAVKLFGKKMEGDPDITGKIVRSGAASFVYLEVLDASFSFDGVIGAFAITNDIVMIALGLGIGAMFVRSMTVALVNGGHLAEYRYLEPGAFYAIMALATIMLISIRVETPEVVTGLIGAGFIGLAFWSSVRHKRLHPEEYAEDGEADAIMPDGSVVKGVHTA
jgi:hypothetical protein